MKIRDVEVIFFTRDYYENPWILPFPFQVYKQGALSVKDHISYTGVTSLISKEKGRNHPTFKVFNVTTFPTILFVDRETGMTLVRLEGMGITKNAVASTLLFLENLSKDGEGNYYKRDGSLWRSKFGAGILNLPVPPIVSLIAGAISIKKALDSKTTLGQMGYGTIAYLLLNNWQKSRKK